MGSVIYDLIGAGPVRESSAVDAAGARTGRPPQLLSLEPDAAYALGLDVAHDQVRAILTDVVGTSRWELTDPLAVTQAGSHPMNTRKRK